MSREDVERYYNQITDDYMELIESLKEMEELAAQDLVNPDKVDALRAAVEPLKNNYMTISWIMFLLNKPKNKNKLSKYERQLANKMRRIDPGRLRTPDNVHTENLNVLQEMHDVWEGDCD